MHIIWIASNLKHICSPDDQKLKQRFILLSNLGIECIYCSHKLIRFAVNLLLEGVTGFRGMVMVQLEILNVMPRNNEKSDHFNSTIDKEVQGHLSSQICKTLREGKKKDYPEVHLQRLLSSVQLNQSLLKQEQCSWGS